MEYETRMLQFSVTFVQLPASTFNGCLSSPSGIEQSQSCHWNGLVQFQVWTESSISKLKPAVLSYPHIKFTIPIMIPPFPFLSEQYQKTVHQPPSILTQTNTAERWLPRLLYFRQHSANLQEERSVILVRLQFTKLQWHQVASSWIWLLLCTFFQSH